METVGARQKRHVQHSLRRTLVRLDGLGGFYWRED